MLRIVSLCCCVLLLFSCQRQNQEQLAETTVNMAITTEKWPKKATIGPRAKVLLEGWVEFQELETSFDALYTVANREDLQLVLEGIIAKEKALDESQYPETFEKPQIRGRQKMFKTFVLKVQGDLFYRLDYRESVLQMIAAYNTFRNQFNILVRSTLDTKLILEE